MKYYVASDICVFCETYYKGNKLKFLRTDRCRGIKNTSGARYRHSFLEALFVKNRVFLMAEHSRYNGNLKLIPIEE